MGPAERDVFIGNWQVPSTWNPRRLLLSGMVLGMDPMHGYMPRRSYAARRRRKKVSAATTKGERRICSMAIDDLQIRPLVSDPTDENRSKNLRTFCGTFFSFNGEIFCTIKRKYHTFWPLSKGLEKKKNLALHFLKLIIWIWEYVK